MHTVQKEDMSVDRDRWKRAQEWELAFWQRAQVKTGWKKVAFRIARPILSAIQSRRATGDDWNHWWRDQFEGYSFLPDHLGDYIELGCGPYTNTRLVLKDRSADRVVCSDPLAEQYLEFSGRWLADAARKGKIEIDANPIEELPFPPSSFDVVVIINVLDHVMDADACMRNSHRAPEAGRLPDLRSEPRQPEDAREARVVRGGPSDPRNRGGRGGLSRYRANARAEEDRAAERPPAPYRHAGRSGRRGSDPGA